MTDDAIPTAARAPETTALPSAPSPPPRPLTPRVWRRAWMEPSVRVWWLLAAAVSCLMLVYAFSHVWAWGTQNHLILHGTPISAKLIEGDAGSSAHLTMSHENVEADAVVTLEFDWQGKPMQVRDQLEGRTERLTVGDMVPIRVDPKNPNRWTYRSEPIPLIHALFVDLVLLPIPPLLAVMALLRRKRLVAIWRQSQAAMAMVMDRRQTPIAPLSYAVRCSLIDRRDRRLFTVYVPRSAAVLNKGDLLWVIAPADRRGAAVAAVWME